MHPELFEVFGFHVHSWGALVALAFIAGVFIAASFGKREGIKRDDVIDGAMWVIFSGLIGARVFYIIGFPGPFLNDPLSVFALWEGGMVFYGGLVFSMVTIILFCRSRNIPVLRAFDIATPAAAVGYAIGRVGCLLNGCCYGVPCSLPWAMTFPESMVPVHPTQIYSIVSGLIIFAVVWAVYRRKAYDGQVLLWGVVMYSVYRFIVESFRFNLLNWAGLSPSQWISIALLAVCTGVILIVRKKASR